MKLKTTEMCSLKGEFYDMWIISIKKRIPSMKLLDGWIKKIWDSGMTETGCCEYLEGMKYFLL